MTTIRGIKFGKKGLRDASGRYYPAWYSVGRMIDGTVSLTIYAKSILIGLPRELNVINDTEIMTDCFEKDRVRFAEGSAEFEALKGFAG